MLDDSVEHALGVIIAGLKDKDKHYRLKCAEILLKKTMPDRQNLDFGDDGKIEIEFYITDATGPKEKD